MTNREALSTGTRRAFAGAIATLLAATASAAAEGEDPLHTLFDEILANRGDREALIAERDGAEGEQRDLLEERIWQERLEDQDRLQLLAEQVAEREAGGDDVSDVRARIEKAVQQGWPRTRDELIELESRLAELRAERDAAPADDKPALTRRVRLTEQRVEDSYRLLIGLLGTLETTGLDVADERSFVAERLTAWADRLSARLQLQLRGRAEVAERLAPAPDDAKLLAESGDVEERIEHTTATLKVVANLLGRIDVPVTRYRQAIIAATGEITTDILDREVALGLLGKIRDQVIDTIAAGLPSWTFKALVFALILLGFRTAARLVRRVVTQSVRNSKVKLSQLLQETLIAWSSRAVMLLGFLIALSQLGIEIGALLAGLGIAGFVLGFALQDSLSNFAAGAMILIYRPFDVGDVVEAAGVVGAVSKMTLVSTTILTFDNQTLIVPNSKIWGDVIRNVTAQHIRRVDLVFGIGYGDDIDHADRVLHEVVEAREEVLDDPKPIIEVHELGDSSVNFVVRPWVKTEDYWTVYWALTREVKQRFDREGITIPFPQRDVHHHYPEQGGPPSDPA